MTYIFTIIIGGDDYAPGPYSVTFPAGMTNVSLNISITDDNIVETDEQFFLIIGPSTLPHVIVSRLSQAVLTITDSDGKYLL